MELKNKSKTKLIVLVASLLVLTTSLTYAFFAGGAGPAANTDVDITSGVTTKLLFTEGTPINLELNETTVAEGGGNVSGTTTSTATLNLGTNVASATENYFVYFDISANNFVYTTAAKTPEILLSITDPDGTAVTLSGLTEVSLGVYDITEYKGLITVASNYEISGSTDTTQEWEAEIIFVNLSTNQAANEGKNLISSFTLQEEENSINLLLRHNGGQGAIEAKSTPNYTETAGNNTGVFASQDDYGTSYYYRGLVDNNWLYFNSIYWRIVRITGDGSIKMIYSGTTAPTIDDSEIMDGIGTSITTSKFSTNVLDNANAGYMYTIGEQHGNTTKSTIAGVIDNWYNENMSNVDHLINDSIFCYDRTLATSGYQSDYYGWNGTTYTGTGIGTSPTVYGTIERLTFSTTDLYRGGSGPDLKCPNKEDAFTVNDEINGNGALSKKVGLLSADETIMGGVVVNLVARTASGYLVADSYWLGSPFGFYAPNGGAKTWYMNSAGYIADNYVSPSSYGVRPVIHLSGDVTLSGTGLWNDPYVVE